MPSTTSKTHDMPRRIGRYRIVRQLSKGGMALVYEARRESLAGVSPRVAIKIILPDYAESDAFRDMFINEARLGAAMQHQNLIQIQDFACEDGRYFLVMEYVEGVTLSRAVSLCARLHWRIPMGIVCELGRQVCDGLHYAHLAVDGQGQPLGLVHRDIKPSNLILNPQGVVKILDFGISTGALRQERAGAVKGTWGYMAPEQALGQRTGPTADMFSLAVVLYELASRRPMFRGKEEAEIRRLLQDDHPARLAATLDPHYEPLAQVLVKALRRDPEARYPDAAAFGLALSKLLPDPITARNNAVRFHNALLRLGQNDAAASAAKPRRRQATASRGSTLRPPSSGPRVPRAVWALGAAFIGGYALVSAAIRTHGDDSEASRPTPPEVAAPERPVQPVERALSHEPPPSSEPEDPDAGRIRVRCDLDGAEVYIDGQLVAQPGIGQSFAPGRHTISILAPDGRRVSHLVDLETGQDIERVCDFNRRGFR